MNTSEEIARAIVREYAHHGNDTELRNDIVAAIDAPRSTPWTCQTCGAQFPHTRGDEDVAQCSKCVEVEALAGKCRTLLAEVERLRAALNDYGRHSSRCGFLADGTLECVCGLQAAICGDGRATGEGR